LPLLVRDHVALDAELLLVECVEQVAIRSDSIQSAAASWFEGTTSK